MQRSAIADTICRTIELGVTITDAALDGEDRTHVFCQVLAPQDGCPRCGQAGRLRDHVDREVADLPIVGHPTRLHVKVPRYACTNAGCATSVFRANISSIVAPRAQVTRRTTAWIMRRMIVDKMSVSAVAASVGLSWNTVNTLARMRPTPWPRRRPVWLVSEFSGSTSTSGNMFAARVIRVS